MTLLLLMIYISLLNQFISGSPTYSVSTTKDKDYKTTDEENLQSTKPIMENVVSLRGGSTANEGNLFVDNQPVCDDAWDLADANVVCRMLGYHAAIRRTQGSAFGKVSTDFGIGHVNCTGTEIWLLDCPHEDGNGCRSCKAAGVVCEPGFKLVLKGGSGGHEGQMFFGNRAVCDKNWDIKDADLVCRLFGFIAALKATKSSKFGSVPDNFIMGNVNCFGNESSLLECSNDDGKNCGPGDAAGVVCFVYNDLAIRLEDGDAPHKGNVFIGPYGVCSDGWEIRDAHVACKMLGYPGAEESFSFNLQCDRLTTHNDDGTFMITNVGCAGVEHSIRNCPYTVNKNCSGEIAGVICYQAPVYNISLSYKGRSSSLEGNVFLQGNPVCDELWDGTDANIACKMLGSSRAYSSSTQSTYGEVPLSFNIGNNFKCAGSEKSLWDCPSKEVLDCGANEGAGMKCAPRTSIYKANLRGGSLTSIYYSGNVYLGSHPLCDHEWDMSLANHVCRLLGYVEASEISYHSKYGHVSASSMVYDVKFKGLEWRLEDVAHEMDDNCPSTKGAGVVCKGYRVQMRGGASVTSGEVYINGQPIHYANWDLPDANVACKMLGFSGAKSVNLGTYHARNTYFKMSNVGCTGDEDNLADCSHTVNYYSSNSNWFSHRGAGVDCFY